MAFSNHATLTTTRLLYGPAGASDADLFTITFENGSDNDFESIDWAGLHEGLASLFVPTLQTDWVLDRIVSGTWVPDGQPYDPNTFVSSSFGFPGEYAPSSGLDSLALPYSIAMLIRRNAQFGRPGKIYYRGGGFTELDLNRSADGKRWKYNVDGVTRVNTIMDTFNSIMGLFQGGGTLNPVMVGKPLISHNWTIVDGKPVDTPSYGATQQRGVTSLVSIRPIYRQLNQ